MPDPNLTYDELRRIVELIKSTSQFSEFRLKVGEVEIELRRQRNDARSTAPGGQGQVAGEGADAASQLAQPGLRNVATHEPPSWPEGCVAIRSPMIGTFYRAPEPGAQPFVAVGQKVEPGTTICIIEVMKLMSSIPAGIRGVVERVLVDDAAAVDTGQALMLLRPE